ncbi:MAG: proton-conducting transporter membrane subunit, partial [Dehalococcoidia bacterium]
MTDLIALIPLFPLLGVLTNLVVGWRRSEGVVGGIACGAIGLAFLAAGVLFVGILGLPPDGRALEQTLYTWIRAGDLEIQVGFLYDPLSAVMALAVSGVSLLIHIYSIGYMHGHRGFTRYFIYLNLFTFSMLLLILGADLVVLFVGWEAVGLCSYLLIGYYYERRSASVAGVKAFLVNRVGDLG